MTVKRQKYYVCTALYIAVAALAGCGAHKPYERSYYVLDASRQAAGDKQKNEVVLEVRRFSIDAAFESLAFVYRLGDSKYGSDSYNWFLTSPAMIITEKTRNWLADSGTCKDVLSPGSIVRPTHVLQGSVIALYGDARNKKMPKAILEIRIFLIDSRQADPQIVFSKTYHSEHALDRADPSEYVAAVNTCLLQILTELEADLRREL